jgi:hypothetical protein
MMTVGFELRKFACSDPSLINNLPEKLRENVEAFEIGHSDHQIKTLGVAWQPMTDKLLFNVRHLDSPPESAKDLKRKSRQVVRSRNPDSDIPGNLNKKEDEADSALTSDLHLNPAITKRQMLSDIAKNFDPLGFLAPVLVKLKICMQQVWKESLGWDDLIPPKLAESFFEWRRLLPAVRQVRIPRCVMPQGVFSSIELHVFVDASEAAYGAVIYVRVAADGPLRKVSFLTAKTKVAPVKTQSIARLELCAALVGARLIQSAISALQRFAFAPLIKIFGWTDSTTVLQWLNK